MGHKARWPIIVGGIVCCGHGPLLHVCVCVCVCVRLMFLIVSHRLPFWLKALRTCVLSVHYQAS